MERLHDLKHEHGLETFVPLVDMRQGWIVTDILLRAGRCISSGIVFSLALLLLNGCGMNSFLVTPVKSDMRLEELTVYRGKGWSSGKIAIIEVEGMLMNARAGGLFQQGENSLSLFTEQL